jgi:hypothetical protein
MFAVAPSLLLMQQQPARYSTTISSTAQQVQMAHAHNPREQLSHDIERYNNTSSHTFAAAAISSSSCCCRPYSQLQQLTAEAAAALRHLLLPAYALAQLVRCICQDHQASSCCCGSLHTASHSFRKLTGLQLI